MMSRFFLVIPPGFEEQAVRECQHWLNILGHTSTEHSVQTGGIEIKLDLATGFQLNRVLKIPTRILLRLDVFRCRDFPTLFRKIQRIRFRDFAQTGQVEWKVSAHHSRLNHEKRIEQTCRDAYAAFSKAHEPKKSAQAFDIELHVRIADDTCTVSVNTSGEDLFRRGYRAHIGEAPLRENLAAGILWAMLPDPMPQKIALVDPMMGAGTFLWEAHHLLRPITSRSFAFENFPCCPILTSLGADTPSPFASLSGEDLNPKMIEAAQQNALAAQLSTVPLKVGDAFKIHDYAGQWIVCNPPYGERIELPLPREKFFRELLKSFVSCERFAVIVPELNCAPAQLLSENHRLEKIIAFRNGGLAVQCLIASQKGA